MRSFPFSLPVGCGEGELTDADGLLIGCIYVSGGAKAVVRAVNAHDDLVGALRSLLPFAHEAPDVVLDGALAALVKAMGGDE